MDVIRELPEIFEELAQKKQQSFLTVKEYKDKGIPVIGSYCSYFPRELALAMGAIPIGLCSSSDETMLPVAFCLSVTDQYDFHCTILSPLPQEERPALKAGQNILPDLR